MTNPAGFDFHQDLLRAQFPRAKLQLCEGLAGLPGSPADRFFRNGAMMQEKGGPVNSDCNKMAVTDVPEKPLDHELTLASQMKNDLSTLVLPWFHLRNPRLGNQGSFFSN